MTHHHRDRHGTFSTRPRPLIRYLGGFTGGVAALPSILGCLYFLAHPAEAAASPGSVALNGVLAILLGGSTYRWVTIRGTANRERVTLRGFLKTVRTPTDQLAHIARTEYSADENIAPYYVLIDHQGNLLGRVPSSLEMCQDWSEFVDGLEQLAAESRENAAAGGEAVELSIPDWSENDFDRSKPGP